MRKNSVLLLFVVLIIFTGCDMIGGTSNGSFILESSDSGVASRGIESKNLTPDGIKVAFRSSDIEFWAADGVYEELVSYKYTYRIENAMGEIVDPEGKNVSTEIELSEGTNNVVFMPNNINLSEYEKPVFENKTYDVARMDIGFGKIEFTVDDSPINVRSDVLNNFTEYSDDGTTTVKDNIIKLETNSIVFVDSAILTEVVYAPFKNVDYGEFINNFIKNNPNMDISGALFIPFTPFEVTGDEIEEVKLKINWDLNDIFESVDGDVYTLTENASGTPFDFDIVIEVQ